MDKTLDLKLKNLHKALASLEKATEEKKNDYITDSVIKRFEYSYELLWKTAKLFLSQKLGTDTFSPKECFRELKRNKLINDEKTEILLEMVNDRNEAIHTYNEIFANELYKNIQKNYYKLILEVYNIIKNHKI